MAVFSTEFGSDDPFRDAVEAARAMGEHDALDFSPHIGIASGAGGDPRSRLGYSHLKHEEALRRGEELYVVVTT